MINLYDQIETDHLYISQCLFVLFFNQKLKHFYIYTTLREVHYARAIVR